MSKELYDFEHDARQLRNNLDASTSNQEKAVHVRAFRDKWLPWLESELEQTVGTIHEFGLDSTTLRSYLVNMDNKIKELEGN